MILPQIGTLFSVAACTKPRPTCYNRSTASCKGVPTLRSLTLSGPCRQHSFVTRSYFRCSLSNKLSTKRPSTHPLHWTHDSSQNVCETPLPIGGLSYQSGHAIKPPPRFDLSNSHQAKQGRNIQRSFGLTQLGDSHTMPPRRWTCRDRGCHPA
jgi:hypothetical protein